MGPKCQKYRAISDRTQGVRTSKVHGKSRHVWVSSSATSCRHCTTACWPKSTSRATIVTLTRRLPGPCDARVHRHVCAPSCLARPRISLLIHLDVERVPLARSRARVGSRSARLDRVLPPILCRGDGSVAHLVSPPTRMGRGQLARIGAASPPERTSLPSRLECQGKGGAGAPSQAPRARVRGPSGVLDQCLADRFLA